MARNTSRIQARALVVAGLALVLAGGGWAGAAVAASAYSPVQRTNIDRPVPSGATLLPNGRLVSPAGIPSNQGDFPLGVAISPDGVLAATTQVGQGDGTAGSDFGELCADSQDKNPCGPSSTLPNAGTGPDEQLLVTNLTTGAQQHLRAPQTACAPDGTLKKLNCFELGVVFSPDGRSLYAVGGGNDAVYDFPVGTNDVVGGTPAHTTYLSQIPATGGTGSYQKPNPGSQARRTKGLAVTPDGATLLVTEEQSGTMDLLDAKTLAFQQEIPFGTENPTGSNGALTYPYQVVATNDTAYVSLQGLNAVARVPLVTNPLTHARTAGVPVLTPVGDHPTGLALSPDDATLLVADANDDTVDTLDLAAPTAAAVPLTVHAVPGEVVGSVPNAVAFDGNGRAYVALAGDDAVAVLDRTGTAPFAVSGLVPTGWYPTSVAVRPGGHQLISLSAKGLGSRYPAGGEYPQPAAGGPQADLPGYYDANNMPGLLSEVTSPTTSTLSSYTALVQRNIRYPSVGVADEPHGPIPTLAAAGSSPIKHVVYIVRENRTYDQEYGDLAYTRNDVDADPAFESLASATPQGHAITGRYASSDSFFSDGEASVQGHFWTSSANTDDYVEKSWRQYYSDRNHSSDEVGTTVSAPPHCSLFQSALAKEATDPAFTWMDFGEPVGTFNPDLRVALPNGTTVSGGSVLDSNCQAVPATNADLSNFADFEGIDDRTAATRFLTESGLTASGSVIPGTTATLRNFSYLELPGDHTTGYTAQGTSNLEGHTPRAEIAENDAAVGEVVTALSHSADWSSTAVFVVEDDSQDGPDHVDGHRNILLVASPYARQESGNGCYSGYVSSVHHDQADVVRSIELILGLPALSSYDQLAAPVYDLFQNIATPTDLTAADLAPYTPAADPSFIDEKVGGGALPGPSTPAQLEQESASLNLSRPDVAGPRLEDVLWKSTTAKAEPVALAQEMTGRVARSAGTLADADDAQGTTASLAGVFTKPAADCSGTASGPGANVPEVPHPVLLPLVAVAVGGVLLLTGVLRRRRRDAR